jgi:hypothetical protein
MEKKIKIRIDKSDKSDIGRLPIAPPSKQFKPKKGKGSYDRKKEQKT